MKNTKTADRTLRTSHSAWYIFWIMFSINIFNYLSRYVFSSMATAIAKDLHFGLDGIGFIASAFLIVYTLCTLPLGFLADIMKKKHLIALCTIVWSLSSILVAFATNFTTLFLSRMILGIGEAGYYPAGTALLSITFPESKWGKVMSWLNVGATIGLIIGFILGGLLVSLLPQGWRIVFIATGLPGLLLGFLAWRFRAEDEAIIPANPATPNRSETIRALVKHAWELLYIRSFVFLTIMQLFAFFFLGVAVIFLPTFLQQKNAFAMSAGSAGLYSGLLVTLAGISGTIVGGWLADRWQKRIPGAHLLVCGVGFLVGGITFTLTMISTSLPIFSLFLFLTLFAVNIYNGPAATATQYVVKLRIRATAVAFSMMIAHLFGDTFAPSIIGVATSALDPTHGQHFFQNMAGQDLRVTLLASCPIALLLAGIAGIWGARYVEKDRARASSSDVSPRIEPSEITR